MVKAFGKEECNERDWCAGAKQLLKGEGNDPVFFKTVTELMDHHKNVRCDSFYDARTKTYIRDDHNDT